MKEKPKDAAGSSNNDFIVGTITITDKVGIHQIVVITMVQIVVVTVVEIVVDTVVETASERVVIITHLKINKSLDSSVVGQTGEVNIGNRPTAIADRMEGKANEGSAVICGVTTNVLVDSGSMVTLVSESFYNSLEPKPELCSMSCFNLDLIGVCGTCLPY
ncbi:hypothetical protein DPMN_168737 [Dreissena polymorpha]|uniref:Uncharacterized protein n=1 Tax=Dreissena polymorpha TaxID=45954 RepID=A0A9D4IXI4_DREPO|nr:hypothetical protein DPMN_168737 [Dreissena polymorpha]